VFAWIPSAAQLGPAYLPFAVSDAGTPPASVDGTLGIHVAPLDQCTEVACDPATGCQGTLVPLDEPCCTGEPTARVPEAIADCPDGRVLQIGRNTTGFGQLANCHRLRAFDFSQAGAVVRLNIRTRCLRIDEPVTVQARMETRSRLVFDRTLEVVLRAAADGYAERTLLSLPVEGGGPYFDLEGAEAQFEITVTDADGTAVRHDLRVVLTFNPVLELPEV
jgi:hypothetical protein